MNEKTKEKIKKLEAQEGIVWRYQPKGKKLPKYCDSSISGLPCENCEGTGDANVLDWQKNDNLPYKKCPECNGKGVYPKIKGIYIFTELYDILCADGDDDEVVAIDATDCYIRDSEDIEGKIISSEEAEIIARFQYSEIKEYFGKE